MGGLSIWHILLVLIAILIIFGAGKLPKVMNDMAKGIKSFKEGLNDEEKTEKQKQSPKKLPAPKKLVKTTKSSASSKTKPKPKKK